MYNSTIFFNFAAAELKCGKKFIQCEQVGEWNITTTDESFLLIAFLTSKAELSSIYILYTKILKI